MSTSSHRAGKGQARCARQAPRRAVRELAPQVRADLGDFKAIVSRVHDELTRCGVQLRRSQVMESLARGLAGEDWNRLRARLLTPAPSSMAAAAAPYVVTMQDWEPDPEPVWDAISEEALARMHQDVVEDPLEVSSAVPDDAWRACVLFLHFDHWPALGVRDPKRRASIALALILEPLLRTLEQSQGRRWDLLMHSATTAA